MRILLPSLVGLGLIRAVPILTPDLGEGKLLLDKPESHLWLERSDGDTISSIVKRETITVGAPGWSQSVFFRTGTMTFTRASASVINVLVMNVGPQLVDFTVGYAASSWNKALGRQTMAEGEVMIFNERFDGQLYRNLVQTYSALEDVPYKRDLYTPTGVGAFGCVFPAVMEPNQVFVVKEIKFSSRKEKENIMGEVEFLRRCQHPNILRMIEVYVVDHPGLANAMYIVTSPWAPETLYAFFKDLINSETCISPLCPWYVPGSERPWTAITGGCISAVEYLHKHNIRHRDIKPENILLHCKGPQEATAVIADFGISKNSIMNAATTFHGTYQWMAPEWIIESESTPKVDVFTLGACFAIILAVVLEGRDGLREIWRIGLESGSCQFAANLEDVLAYLERVKLAHFDPRIVVSKLEFHALLIEWVERMIVKEPAGRASMNELQSICNNHDPYFEIVPELSPDRFETLHEMHPWLQDVLLFPRDQIAAAVYATMTLDTASSENFISSSFLNKLDIHKLVMEQEQHCFHTFGGTVTTERAVQLSWRAVKTSARHENVHKAQFIIIESDMTPFEVLLGRKGIREWEKARSTNIAATDFIKISPRLL